MAKERSKITLRNTKVRDFLICLSCALLAWMVSRLSETYTGEVLVKASFIKIPDSLILIRESHEAIPVRIQANGFQMLRYNWSPKKVALNVNGVRLVGNRYYLPEETLRNQLRGQFSAKSTLLGLEQDTLFVNLQRLKSKTVPVRAILNLDLAQNYMLEGSPVIEPEQIRLLGPAEEIDTISELTTLPLKLQNINADFSQKIELVAASRLGRTHFSEEHVTVSGRVFRFSEILVQVPISVINLPENMVIKTFPPAVEVLCRGRVEAIKNLTAEGFKVEADYSAPDPETGQLQLVLSGFPDVVKTAVLREHSVEFIVRRE